MVTGAATSGKFSLAQKGVGPTFDQVPNLGDFMADTESTSILRRLTDELKLQAWLANAELKHPSLKHESARKEVDMLAQARDELRVQIHLGRLEAAEEWDRLEARWGVVKQLSVAADDLGEVLSDVIADIREGYNTLRG